MSDPCHIPLGREKQMEPFAEDKNSKWSSCNLKTINLCTDCSLTTRLPCPPGVCRFPDALPKLRPILSPFGPNILWCLLDYIKTAVFLSFHSRWEQFIITRLLTIGHNAEVEPSVLVFGFSHLNISFSKVKLSPLWVPPRICRLHVIAKVIILIYRQSLNFLIIIIFNMVRFNKTTMTEG